VTPAQEIYEKSPVGEAKEKGRRVYGFYGGLRRLLCCLRGDKIVAKPRDGHGKHRWWIMHFTNVQDLFKKIGLKSAVIKSGRYKDTGSPFGICLPRKKCCSRECWMTSTTSFWMRYRTSRGLPKEKLKEIADGRIHDGPAALQLGLVDYLGDIELQPMLPPSSPHRGKTRTGLSPGGALYDLEYMLENGVHSEEGAMEESSGFSLSISNTGD